MNLPKSHLCNTITHQVHSKSQILNYKGLSWLDCNCHFRLQLKWLKEAHPFPPRQIDKTKSRFFKQTDTEIIKIKSIQNYIHVKQQAKNRSHEQGYFKHSNLKYRKLVMIIVSIFQFLQILRYKAWWCSVLATLLLLGTLTHCKQYYIRYLVIQVNPEYFIVNPTTTWISNWQSQVKQHHKNK